MTEDRRQDPIVRFRAAALMTTGVLMLTLCGGCALLVAGSVVFSMHDAAQAARGLPFLVVPGLVGGLPALGGFYMFQRGLEMWRGSRHPKRTT